MNFNSDNGNRNGNASRSLAIGLSVVAGLICVAAIVLFGRGMTRNDEYVFTAGKDIDVESAEETYLETGSNEDLYTLLLGLCYQLKTDEKPEHIQMIRKYGTEMYDRVKDGKLDLEKLDEDQEQTMAVIDMVNSFGIKP